LLDLVGLDGTYLHALIVSRERPAPNSISVRYCATFSRPLTRTGSAVSSSSSIADSR
jgi:hypothetical protein